MPPSIKPPRLKPGDTVAVLSPSWGGPHKCPHVFDLGLQNIETHLNLRIKEYPTARTPDAKLYTNPKMRAEDINEAFGDPEVQAIFASIGGDDSVRILPFLDLDRILSHPKILMGFSDTTTLTTYLNQRGMVTFNGPSVMAGFAQMDHLPSAMGDHLKAVLFEATEVSEYRPYATWSDRYVSWSTPGYGGEVFEPQTNSEGWRWIQGNGISSGLLYGGCIEVLEFMKGTRFWPEVSFWEDRILFLETSEEKPTVTQFKYFLRNYGSMGVLDRLKGILVGRARGYTPAEKEDLYAMLQRVVATEFGREDLPILANLDFGHTDPQWVMPLGVIAEIDCNRQTLRLIEPAVL